MTLKYSTAVVTNVKAETPMFLPKVFLIVTPVYYFVSHSVALSRACINNKMHNDIHPAILVATRIKRQMTWLMDTLQNQRRAMPTLSRPPN